MRYAVMKLLKYELYTSLHTLLTLIVLTFSILRYLVLFSFYCYGWNWIWYVGLYCSFLVAMKGYCYQKGAVTVGLHIIFSFTRSTSYPNVLGYFVANLDSLSDRRDKLSRTFFQNMCKPASCLHHLLPPPRNTSPISRLRSSIPLPRPTSRTKKVPIICKFRP